MTLVPSVFNGSLSLLRSVTERARRRPLGTGDSDLMAGRDVPRCSTGLVVLIAALLLGMGCRSQRDEVQAPQKGPPPGPNTPAAAGPAAPPAPPSAAVTEKEPVVQVAVATDKRIYRSGDTVTIHGRVISLKPKAPELYVELRVTQAPFWTDKGKETDPVYRVFLPPNQLDFTHDGFTVQLPLNGFSLLDTHAEFRVMAKVNVQSLAPNEKTDASTTKFQVEDIGFGRLLVTLIPVLLEVVS